MAGKNRGVNRSKLKAQQTQLSDMTEMEWYAKHEWDFSKDLDGSVLASSERVKVNSVLREVERSARDDFETFYDMYGSKFADEAAAQVYHGQLQDMTRDIRVRSSMSNLFKNFRDTDFALLKPERREFLLQSADVFDLPKAYGYESMDEVNQVLARQRELTRVPRAKTLNGLQDVHSRGTGSMYDDMPVHPGLAELALQDYQRRTYQRDNQMMESAIYSSGKFGNDPQMGARVREYNMAQGIINHLADMHAHYSDEDFLNRYGDKFESEEAALKYFRDDMVNRRPDVLIEQFRNLNLAMPAGDNLSPEMADYYKFVYDTANCFDVAQIYGYSSFDEVQAVLHAGQNLECGQSLKDIAQYDMRHDDPFSQKSDQILALKRYVGRRESGLVPETSDASDVFEASVIDRRWLENMPSYVQWLDNANASPDFGVGRDAEIQAMMQDKLRRPEPEPEPFWPDDEAGYEHGGASEDPFAEPEPVPVEPDLESEPEPVVPEEPPFVSELDVPSELLPFEARVKRQDWDFDKSPDGVYLREYDSANAAVGWDRVVQASRMSKEEFQDVYGFRFEEPGEMDAFYDKFTETFRERALPGDIYTVVTRFRDVDLRQYANENDGFALQVADVMGVSESYGYEKSEYAVSRLAIVAENDGHSNSDERTLNGLTAVYPVGGKDTPQWALISEQIVDDYLRRVGEPFNTDMRSQLYKAPMLDKQGLMEQRVDEYWAALKAASWSEVVSDYSPEQFVQEYGDKFDNEDAAKAYLGELHNNPRGARNLIMNFRDLNFLSESQSDEMKKVEKFRDDTLRCFDVAKAYGYDDMSEVLRVQEAGRAIGAGFSLNSISRCEFGAKGLNENIGPEDLALVQEYDRRKRFGLDVPDDIKSGVDSAAEFWRESQVAENQPGVDPDGPEEGPTYTPEQGDYIMANVIASAQKGGDFDRDVWLEREAAAREARVAAYEAAHKKGPVAATKNVAEDMKQQLGDAVNYLKPKIQVKKRKLSFTDKAAEVESGEKSEKKPRSFVAGEDGTLHVTDESKQRRLKKSDKQAKPEEPAKPPKAPKNVVHKNSKTESEYIDDLMEKIATCKYDFVTYQQDVSRWTNPTEVQRQTDLRTKAYVHNMLDFCMSPLQNGVSPGNCVDCIGIYIGMAVASPEFRKYTNASVAKALYPVTAARMKTVDAFRDCLPKATQRMVNWTERRFDCKVPFISDKIKSYEFRSDTTNARLEAKKEKFLKDLNNGRVPLTPETAALHYVSFVQQAYEKMHSPEVKEYSDCVKIQKSLQSATDTLKLLAERDGVNEADLNENVRALVGTLTTQHPEMRTIFYETAGFTVEQGKGREVTFNDKTVGHVWHGEYNYTQVGKDGQKHPFDGVFKVRYPSAAKVHVKQLSQYMSSLMKDIDNPDVIQALGASDIADKIRDHFKQNVVEDMKVPYVEESFKKLCRTCAETRIDAEISAGNAEFAGMTKEQREAKIDEIAKDIRPEQAVWEQGVFTAAKEWFEKHPGAKELLRQRDEVANHQFSEAEMAAEAVAGERAKDLKDIAVDQETAGGLEEANNAPMPELNDDVNVPPADSNHYEMQDVLQMAAQESQPKPQPEQPAATAGRELGQEFEFGPSYEGTEPEAQPDNSDAPDAGDY